MKHRRVIALAAGLLSGAWLHSHAATTAPPASPDRLQTPGQQTVPADATRIDRPWTTNLYLENDLFGETDQNYSSGIRLSWVSPNLSSYRDDPVVPEAINSVNDRFDSLLNISEGLTRNVVVSIGQLIYTPADRDATELQVDDRPYAGYLYLGFGYHARTAERLDSVGINLGVVGPAALGEQAQDAIHDLRNMEKFQGWDNQLRNEPVLQLVYENKLRLFNQPLPFNMQHDFISHAGIAIGNVGSYLNVGGEYRIGWDLPEDFGTSAVRPAGDNSAPGKGDMRLILSDSLLYGLHGFMSVDGRLVGNDIFLDGNTWRDSHSISKEYLVADVSVGMSFLVRQWKVSYGQVFRTREFKGQEHHHEYGSLSISYTW